MVDVCTYNATMHYVTLEKDFGPYEIAAYPAPKDLAKSLQRGGCGEHRVCGKEELVFYVSHVVLRTPMALSCSSPQKADLEAKFMS